MKLLISSFSKDYEPPGAHHNEEDSFKHIIADCSSRGKLLVLSITCDGNEAPFPAELPEESYKVISFNYNSSFAFSVVQQLPITSLPFCGVFFCNSANIDEMELVLPILKDADILRINNVFLSLAEELLNRRERYETRQLSREIVNDQDDEFHRLEREAAEKEEKLRREMEEQEKAEKEKLAKIEERKRTIEERYRQIPAEPEPAPTGVTTIRCVTPNGEKIRRFDKQHKIQYLYDFIAIEYPEQYAHILFGFPQKEITDFDQTFQSAGFMKNESVFVTFTENEDDDQ